MSTPSGQTPASDGASPELSPDDPAMLASVLEELRDGVLVVDRDGGVEFCNGAFRKLWPLDDGDGAPEDATALLGRLDARLENADQVRAHLARALRRPGARESCLLKLEDGRVLEQRWQPRREDGRVVGKIATLRNVTRHKKARDELERLAYRDVLTDLPNRRLLREQAERAFAHARRNGHGVGLVYFDLAGFKVINDALGHDAGDTVLEEVADRLRETIRGEDVAARIGGDEFAVLLGEVEDESAALAATRRLTGIFRTPVRTDVRSVHVKSRFGLALFPAHAEGFDELLARADRAMYEARMRGPNAVEVYRSELSITRREELDRQEELREAIEEGQLELRFQPVFSIMSGELVGAETLVRWEHPDAGLLMPGEFIGLAERSGLIRRLDRWVLGHTVARARSWVVEDGLEWVAVNVSSTSFHDPNFPVYVQEVLRETDVDPGRLVLEVTESAAVRDPEFAARTLRTLRELGVQVALDDFGTGQSALAHLRSLPTDTLKIDISFIQGLEESRENEELVRSLIRLAHGLDLQVVAEGVETEDQYYWLEAAGCDLVQGYHTGPPMHPLELF